jgi:hypothetical protein
MACGCVMLGANGSFYDGLGLETGVHFLAHDGTVDSIRAAITRASNDPQRMEAMAQAGRNYIEANCTPQAVWDSLERNLAQLVSGSKP